MTATGTSSESRTNWGLDVALWTLTAVCLAVTLWFSFFEAPPGAGAFTGADKVGHGLAYFATALSFLFAAVWRPGRGEGRWPRLGMWVPVAAVAFGVPIELLQGLTPKRTPEARDVVAEAVGAVLAIVVHGAVRRWAKDRPGDVVER